ncbi:OstA family protein [Hyphomonas polymorpha PS728]|uniref:OstA family protein n=1 Tax=Hyphomonas polymorpha PS728 TaxID=1280954 RepID=A0A062VE16_9PROT|nr:MULTISPECIES: LptA/OstA family protein [Hyphomonas]AXE65756.1 OstA family protein [Hyphomonas sp. CACIAM 19H1]KCZ98577.1 OstA family protein [Hyphomonas polymorpha PS728]
MALLKAAGIGLVLGLLMGVPAHAQISSEGGPIYINSERTESLERERKVLLVGNVDIRQGTARLRADTVTILFTGEPAPGASTQGVAAGFGQVQSIVAEGNVYYVTPELKAKGDRGIYELATDTITMTGNVALMRDRDVAEGQRLKMEIGNRRTTLEGGGGRTRMVIDPETQSQANR